MKFENVTVIKEANIYFDGKVTSRTVEFDDGSIKSLGIMLPGEYTFGTGAPELMEIMGGRCEIKLQGDGDFREIQAGESFDVPGNSSFDIVVREITDYCCTYL